MVQTCALPILMAGGAALLGAGAPLILYGPYLDPEAATAASNLDFDANLRARNSAWWLRDLDRVKAVAAEAGLRFAERLAVRANNLMLLSLKACMPEFTEWTGRRIILRAQPSSFLSSAQTTSRRERE